MQLSVIKSQLASGLRRSIQSATGLSVIAFSFMPTKLGTVFESLPSILVHNDPENIDQWRDTDQGQDYVTFVEVELWCELSEDDDGAASETLIHQMKETGETYLVGTLIESQFNGRIAGSRVEGLAFEVSDLGIRMRYAWFHLELGRSP